jgi:CheY-like chemotaxis protein
LTTFADGTDLESLPRRCLSIVIADNDPAILELLSTDLALEGHRVVATALTGEEAITACMAHRPDVLITDYRMPPGLNGIETIRRVRAADSAETCILYTNYRSPAIATVAKRIGAVYVRKGVLRTLRAALPS